MSRKQGGRSIFEEVAEGAPSERPAARPGAIARAARPGARGGLKLWFGLLSGLVALWLLARPFAGLWGFGGLALPGWHPLWGVLPPLSPESWEAARNAWLAGLPSPPDLAPDLATFQGRYMAEWALRHIGVLALVVWALGLAGFAAARALPRGWGGRLWGFGAVLLGLVLAARAGPLWAPAMAALPGAVWAGLWAAALAVAMGLGDWHAQRLGQPEAVLIQARRARARGPALLAALAVGAAIAQIGLGAALTAQAPGLAARALLPAPGAGIEGLLLPLHLALGAGLLALALGGAWAARRAAQRAALRSFGALAVVALAQLALGYVHAQGRVTEYGAEAVALTHLALALSLLAVALRARFVACYPPARSLREG